MKFTSILAVLALASATLATPVLEERHHDKQCRGRGRVETVYKKVYKAKTTVTKTKTKTYTKTKHWCKHDPWRHVVKTKTATKHITTTNTINFTSTKIATVAVTLPAETSTSTITEEAPVETVIVTVQKTVDPVTIIQTTTASAEPVTVTVTSTASGSTVTTTASGTQTTPEPTEEPAPVCTPPANLVKSGSFEDNNNVWSWSYTGAPVHEDLVGTTPWGGHTGLNYFSSGAGGTTYNAAPFVLNLKQTITFCLGRKYNFSAWYRAEGVSWDFEASFTVKVGGVEIGTSPSRSIRSDHGESWYKVGPFEFEPKGESEMLEVISTASRSSGDAGRGREIHIDDVVIEAI